MAIKSVTRGCTVKFTVRFYDYNSAAIQPPTASVKLVYTSNNVPQTNTLPLVYDANSASFGVEWSTVGVDLGTVDWHAWTTSLGSAAEDGQIVVVGNKANQ